jgi:catechol 2,3-dioxygenase-like lactoylglutathione lyase family enzyme
MNLKLHHIHLLCSDLEVTIRFFTEILGATLIERKKFMNAPGASLDLNGTTINLRIAREDEKVLKEEALQRYGYNHIGLSVADIEDAYRRLTDKGYVFSIPPKEVGKNRIAFFNGPDNITIELLQPLGQ